MTTERVTVWDGTTSGSGNGSQNENHHEQEKWSGQPTHNLPHDDTHRLDPPRGDTANERVGHQDRQRLKIRSSDSNLRDEQNCRQNMTYEQVSRLLVRLRRGLPTATSVFIFGQCLAHLIEVSLRGGVPRA